MMQDLSQEGFIGLLKAFDRYDITTGNKFITYAVPYVRGYMLHVHDKRGVINTPHNIVRAAWKIERHELWESTNAEINKQLDLNDYEITGARIYFTAKDVASLDKGRNNTNDGLYNASGFHEDLSTAIADEYIKKLNKQEAYIATRLSEGYTQAETYRMMGLSRMQMNRIIKSMRIKIRMAKGVAV